MVNNQMRRQTCSFRTQEPSSKNKRSYKKSRSGIAILLVMVCMIVITSLVGTMLRHIAMNKRQSRQRMHAIQAFWLADSEIERAVLLLQEDPDFRNETRTVSPDSFDGKSAQLDIQISELPDDSTRLVISVLATYPHKSAFSVKARRQVRVKKATLNRPIEVSTSEEDDDAN